MKNDIDLTENSAFADEEEHRRYKHKCLPWAKDGNPNGLVKMKSGEIEFKSSFGKYYYVNTTSWIDNIMSTHNYRFDSWEPMYSTTNHFTYRLNTSTNNSYETIFNIDMGDFYPSSMITADFNNIKYKLTSTSSENDYSIVGTRDEIKGKLKLKHKDGSKYSQYIAKSICTLHDLPIVKAPWNLSKHGNSYRCIKCKIESLKREKILAKDMSIMDRWYKRSFGFRRRALTYYNETLEKASVFYFML